MQPRVVSGFPPANGNSSPAEDDLDTVLADSEQVAGLFDDEEATLAVVEPPPVAYPPPAFSLPPSFPTENFPPPTQPPSFRIPPQFPTEFPPPSSPDVSAPYGEALYAPDGSPIDGPNPEAIAALEQEELLGTERKRAWHQRTWLRFLMVLALLAGIAAVIPYPLRVTAECTIIPRERVNVRSELQGTISQILVDEGQLVKKGDEIARLDDRALQSERRKTLAEIERFTAEVAILKMGHRDEEIQRQQAIVSARKTEVVFAQREASRRHQMARQGVGSLQSADEARGDLENKKRAVSEAEAQLRLLRAGARPEEIAAREAVLKRAQAELEYVDEKITMTVIRAPIGGEILTPRFRERLNEGVEMGGLICEIANTRTMRAEILVPQRDVDAISVGMPVTVKVESHPTHPFEGKVTFMSPAVEGTAGHVRVVAEIDNAKGLLKPNMTGYGEIESGDRSVLHLATRRIVRWIRVRFLI